MSTGEFSIVIIEDNMMYSELLKQYLLRTVKNSCVTTFLCSEDYLNVMDTLPDLIILDFQLDGTSPESMNGLEFMSHLFRNQLRCPIIVLTGTKEIHPALDVMKVGAYDVLIKDRNSFNKLDKLIGKIQYSKKLAGQLELLEVGRKQDKVRLALALAGFILVFILTILMQ